jgi:large-conductance mechanosensitive channel
VFASLVSFVAAEETDTKIQMEKALRFLKITYDEATKCLGNMTSAFPYVFSVWVISHFVVVAFCIFIFHRTMRKRRANKEEVTLREIIAEKYPLYFIYGLISEE